MAETIGALSVDLRLMSAKFEQKMNTVNGKLNGLGKQAQTVNRIFGSLLAVGGAAAFTNVIKGSLDAANRLNDLSDRLGVSVEGFSRLEYAAKTTGVSTQTLAMGLQRMTRRVSEAANGSGEAIGALQELGISAEKLNALRPEQAFEILADALDDVPNKADKVRLAMKLFDSEGVSLLQTMKGGAGAIRKLGEESDRAGGTISKEFAESATAANKAMIKLGTATTGVTNQMAITMGPTIVAIANALTEFIPDAAGSTTKSFRLMAAGVTESLANVVGAVRSVTSFTAGFSDGLAKRDAELATIQERLHGASSMIFEDMLKAEKSSKTFRVEQGETVLSLNDFIGKTKSATEATKNKTEAVKQATEAERKRQEILNNEQEQRSRVATNFDAIRVDLLTEEQLENESFNRKLQTIRSFIEQNQELRVFGMEVERNLKEQHEQALIDIEEKSANNRIKLEEKVTKAKQNMQSSVATSGLSLLRTLASGNKKAAMAVIAVETALNISRAIQNTASASMVAMSQLGPIAGPPAVAGIQAMGAANVALIAANGALQIGSSGGSVSAGVGGGNFSGNTASQQLPTIPAKIDDDSKRPINLIIQKDAFGNLSVVEQLDEFREIIEETDYVFISPASRNGRLLAL